MFKNTTHVLAPGHGGLPGVFAFKLRSQNNLSLKVSSCETFSRRTTTSYSGHGELLLWCHTTDL